MALTEWLGNCVACGVFFGFNPESVPSLRVRREGNKPVPDEKGEPEPLCPSCARTLISNLSGKGLRSIVIDGHADDVEEVA